jgi:hypothetical protein
MPVRSSGSTPRRVTIPKPARTSTPARTTTPKRTTAPARTTTTTPSRTTATSTNASTATPGSTDSFGGAITNAIGQAIDANFGSGSSSGSSGSGKPDWAVKPREPGGEGMFKGKTEEDIFRRMSPDDLAGASPREIFAMTAFQVSAFEKNLSGGPAVYDKYKGQGENGKLTPAQEKALGEETSKAYNENMAKLSPEQQKAFTYAKIHQGIFKDMMSFLMAHSKIAG